MSFIWICCAQFAPKSARLRAAQRPPPCAPQGRSGGCAGDATGTPSPPQRVIHAQLVACLGCGCSSAASRRRSFALRVLATQPTQGLCAPTPGQSRGTVGESRSTHRALSFDHAADAPPISASRGGLEPTTGRGAGHDRAESVLGLPSQKRLEAVAGGAARVARASRCFDLCFLGIAQGECLRDFGRQRFAA